MFHGVRSPCQAPISSVDDPMVSATRSTARTSRSVPCGRTAWTERHHGVSASASRVREPRSAMASTTSGGGGRSETRRGRREPTTPEVTTTRWPRDHNRSSTCGAMTGEPGRHLSHSASLSTNARVQGFHPTLAQPRHIPLRSISWRTGLRLDFGRARVMATWSSSSGPLRARASAMSVRSPSPTGPVAATSLPSRTLDARRGDRMSSSAAQLRARRSSVNPSW